MSNPPEGLTDPNEDASVDNSTAPRIKLKLRINPSSQTVSTDIPSASGQLSGSEDEDSHRKKKRHRGKEKKKRTYKRQKKERFEPDSTTEDRRDSVQIDIDDDGDDDISTPADQPAASAAEGYAEETEHMPVGGKRPFALIDAESHYPTDNFNDSDNEDSDDYEDQEDGTPAEQDAYSIDSSYRVAESASAYGDSNEKPGDSLTGLREDEDDETASYNYSTDYAADNIATNNSVDDYLQHRSRKSSVSTTSLPKAPSSVGRPRSGSTAKQEQKPKKRGRPAKNKTPVKQEPRTVEAPKKDLQSICLKLLDNLEKRDAYGLFLQPVDTNVVTDYLEVIKSPMDFSTMRTKLKENRYSHMDEFEHDFMLIVTNAKTYNAPDTIYYRSADRLQQYGIKAIERAKKTVVYETNEVENYRQEEYTPTDSRTKQGGWLGCRSSSISSATKKEANVKVEEEVDILGLDNPTTTLPSYAPLRFDEQIGGGREYGTDISSSRAASPLRGTPKKKKKKVTETGVAYAPDGSLSGIGGVPDLYNLIPPDTPFATCPDITIINMQALPSAFYQNRTSYEEWQNNKHMTHPAQFCDYGAFTSLGPETPGVFYTAQDACYIYPLYGDDRGEAYMRSLWDFVNDLDLDDFANEKARYLTRGAWDAFKETLKDVPDAKKVDAEFGTVDVPSIVESVRSDIEKSG